MEKIIRHLLLPLVLFCALPLVAQYKLSINLNEYTYPETNALSSSAKTFIIRGQGITSNLTVSTTNPRFRAAVSTIAPTAIDPDNGYSLVVFFEPTVLGEQKGDLTITDAVANKSVKCTLSGTANAFQPSLSVKGAPVPFSTVLFTPSKSQTITITGKYLSENEKLNIAAPTGFEISLDDQNYSSTLSLTASSVNDTDRILYIRLNAQFVSSFEGNLKIETNNFSCPSVVVALKGKIGKSIPILKESPIVSQNLTLGEPLGNAELLGGAVVNTQNETLAGKFRWVMGDTYDQLPVGVHELRVYFQPDYGYGYETIETTVSLRILAAKQEIIWMQDFSQPLEIGQEVQLTASASSGLPIRYVSNSPEQAFVDPTGLLKALQVGRVRISAFQDGNSDYQEAWGIAYYIDIADPSAEKGAIHAFWDRSNQTLQVQTEERSVVRLFDTYGSLLQTCEVIGEANLTIPSSQSGIIIVNIQNNNQRQQLKIHVNHDY